MKYFIIVTVAVAVAIVVVAGAIRLVREIFRK
jgi:hypothetical protein